MTYRHFSIFCFLAFTLTILAVPAKQGVFTRTQADGTTIELRQYGDEYFHYLTDIEGNWVEEKDGMYVRCEQLSDDQIQERRLRSPRLQANRRRIGGLNIAPRGLVILANFANLSFQSENTREAFDEMHNGDDYIFNGATGSCRQYFIDQSGGQYSPSFDVVGPVTLSQPYNYYGANDRQGNDLRPEEMIVEACQLAKAENPDINFSVYDNDKDGFVDFVYVIYAGHNEAEGAAANTVWPHNYYVYSATGKICDIDGVRIDNYACSSELRNSSGTTRCGIGTFCHEFSHVLGLPDLYATTSSAIHKTMGDWDILDSGPYNNRGRTPPAYSAYERFFMGWLKPVILTERGDFTLEDIQTSNKCYLLLEKGEHNLNGVYPSPTDFYILENKQKTLWNRFIPGEGLMITHIRYSRSKWDSNSVNNDANNMGVDIVEADQHTPTVNDLYNGIDGYSGKQGDLFPYYDVDYFIPYESSPIEAIKHNNRIISFKFKGGTRNLNRFVLDDAGEEVVVGIYTVDGVCTGITDLNLLDEGTYIVYKTKNGERIKSSKIVIPVR